MTKEDIVKRLNLIKESDLRTLNEFDIPHEPLKKEIEALEAAIELIEQEPSEDCVSRQAVVQWLENATDDSIEHAIDSNLEFIPLVTPTENWIPVSEKLPESQENDDKDFSDWLQITVKSDIQDQQMYVTEGYYCFSEQKWYIKRFLVGEVIAWKSLPEPYRAEARYKK